MHAEKSKEEESEFTQHRTNFLYSIIPHNDQCFLFDFAKAKPGESFPPSHLQVSRHLTCARNEIVHGVGEKENLNEAEMTCR